MTVASERSRHDDHRCGSKVRGDQGGTCTLPAGWGTHHVGVGRCRLHGGSTPSQQESARRELVARAANAYGLPVEIDPGEALLAEVHRTAGHVEWLGQMIQQQDPDALVWGVAEETQRGSGEFPGTDVKYGAAPSVWLDLYRKERRHLAEVSATVVKLGLEDRQVRLAEQQGVLVAEMFRRAIAGAGVSAEAQAALEASLVREIRAVMPPARVIEGRTA